MLSKAKYKANRRLSSVRIAVEHAFGHVAIYWTYTAFAKGLTSGNQPVAAYFATAILLTNCLKCLRGSQTSTKFVYEPPSLEEYLQVS